MLLLIAIIIFFGSGRGEEYLKKQKNHTFVVGGLFCPYEHSEVINSSWIYGEPFERCKDFHIAFFLSSAAARFAVEEINSSSNLSTEIIYVERQYCSSPVASAERMLNLTNSANPKVIVVGATSENFIRIGHLSSLYNIPTIAAYSTSDTFFKQKKDYRTTFRTIPSDRHQIKALVELSSYFDWKWIGIVAVDDDYGQNGLRGIVEEARYRNICVAFHVYIQTNRYNYSENVERFFKIMNHTNNIEVVYFYTSSVINLHEFFSIADELRIRPCVWIASEGWADRAAEFYKYNVVASIIGVDVKNHRIHRLLRYKSVCDAVERNNSTLSSHDFQEWLCKEILKLNESCDLCSQKYVNELSNFDINEWLEPKMDYVTYTTYLAIQAIARALQDVESCTKNISILEDGCPKINELYPWQLMGYLQNANFTDNNGSFYQFTENCDVRPSYIYRNTHINNEGETEDVTVGFYKTNSSGEPIFYINGTAIRWNRTGGKVPKGRCSPDCPPGGRTRYAGGQTCCFICLRCPPKTKSTKINSSECVDCSHETYSNDANTQCLPKVPDIFDYNSNTAVALSVLCIFGSTASVASGLMFYWKRDTPLGFM
ncbi:extracellular calcium-sensing receptor-like [Anneissia japonica]|uniref:extracellular calcium-sensing receptor-like n=1 Tax=Anneissia japonica TaxID=1529436 RepID=UPI0014257E72|nr:extracellular calcium-sensing receptor-like [Anneissia japonica]